MPESARKCPIWKNRLNASAQLRPPIEGQQAQNRWVVPAGERGRRRLWEPIYFAIPSSFSYAPNPSYAEIG